MGAHLVSNAALCVPGHAVSGGGRVLALHVVASWSPSDSGGAAGRVVVTELIHAGLPRHVEPHGLLVVDVDALSGRNITLVGGEEDIITSLTLMKWLISL